MENDIFLSPAEQDIAARLASYHRKITDLRKIDAVTEHLAAGEIQAYA